MTDWVAPLYDELMADAQLVRDEPARAERSADAIARLLRLKPGDRVFDQCCGIGTLALPLARRGLAVVGVDQARAYVERARREARAAGLAVALSAGDAREFAASPPCAGAFNWSTGFGHAPDDAGNQAMLGRAFESLAPGGRLAVDYLNLPGVLRGFRARIETRRVTPRGELLVRRECRLDLAAGVMLQDWTFVVGGVESRPRRTALRLYMPDVLARMLAACGFADIELLGSEAGEPLALDSPRCVALARRPP